MNCLVPWQDHNFRDHVKGQDWSFTISCVAAIELHTSFLFARARFYLGNMMRCRIIRPSIIPHFFCVCPHPNELIPSWGGDGLQSRMNGYLQNNPALAPRVSSIHEYNAVLSFGVQLRFQTEFSRIVLRWIL